ncbi:hypothetical protein [Chroococcidiopsis sp. CCMEE 29]|uniref:hypothetical protein n=1 Tax=Chroococcidiopsis sp. CCMEE 29 TaxID=155894 RepID=UPI0020208ED2|nr:hypothetical protein [Chroococcidiopsis sp. CCMEE 29]
MNAIQTFYNKLFNLDLKSHTAFTALLVLVFLAFGLIGILNHEMWPDEIQAWLIARDSTSFSNLFKNLRYEGHPGLWHSLLYLITRFTRNPLSIQFLHLLLATSTIYVFTRFSPFTRLQKVLFAFGYFPFYEYSIISRNYSLGVLLIFLFCIFFPRRNYGYILLAILLALLANTNAYSLVLSICLAMTLLVDRFLNKGLTKLFWSQKWDLIISASIFTLGVIFSLMQIVPPSDSNYYEQENKAILEQPSNSIINIRHLIATVITIWRGYVPVPNFFEYHFWNTNILMEGSGVLKIIALIFSLGLLYFSIVLFSQKPVVLFLYLTGTLGLLLLTYEKYFGFSRHHGHLFIWLIACLWISSYYPKSKFLTTFQVNKVTDHKNKFLTIILCLHVFAGIFAFSMDLFYPFSGSQEVANFIERQRLNDTVIVGSRDLDVSPLAAFLDRKIYYPESGRFGSFILWNSRYRKEVGSKTIISSINQFVKQKTNTMLLVLTKEIDVLIPNYSISAIYKSSRSIVAEQYYLYLIQRKPDGDTIKLPLQPPVHVPAADPLVHPGSRGM